MFNRHALDNRKLSNFSNGLNYQIKNVIFIRQVPPQKKKLRSLIAKRLFKFIEETDLIGKTVNGVFIESFLTY